MNDCLIVFSCKSISEVASLGGVGWFRLDKSRAEACRFVVVFHNSNDKRKPGDPKQHRFPVLIAEICGTHVDTNDGRIAVRVIRVASVDGPRQVGGGRSPIGYAKDGFLNGLRIGPWQEVQQTTLAEAMADRASWDAAHQERTSHHHRRADQSRSS